MLWGGVGWDSSAVVDGWMRSSFGLVKEKKRKGKQVGNGNFDYGLEM